MGAVVAGLDVAGEELGLGGDLLHHAGEGRGVVEDDFNLGTEGPMGKQCGGYVSPDPGLRFFEEGGDGAAGGDEIAGANGDGFNAGAGGGADFDFGELDGELGDFGLGLFDAGASLGDFFRAGAKAGDGGDLFRLEGALLGGL